MNLSWSLRLGDSESQSSLGPGLGAWLPGQVRLLSRGRQGSAWPRDPRLEVSQVTRRPGPVKQWCWSQSKPLLGHGCLSSWPRPPWQPWPPWIRLQAVYTGINFKSGPVNSRIRSYTESRQGLHPDNFGSDSKVPGADISCCLVNCNMIRKKTIMALQVPPDLHDSDEADFKSSIVGCSC